MTDYRNEGYDDLLDGLEDDEGYYLECPDGHGSLPPRRACPRCGALDLEERPLPESGTVETFTVVRIATPQLREDTPYVTAVAEFGPLRITGLVGGVDPEAVETGMAVRATVGTTETTGERTLVLRPR